MFGKIVVDMVAYAIRPCLYAESKGCGNVRCSKIAVRGVQCNGTARGMDICKVIAGRVNGFQIVHRRGNVNNAAWRMISGKAPFL